jgi:protocatechuate 3,4-dioxygenase beta subunit
VPHHRNPTDLDIADPDTPPSPEPCAFGAGRPPRARAAARSSHDSDDAHLVGGAYDPGHAHDAGDAGDDFGGLARDLPRFVGRRRALSLLAAGLATAGLAACGSSQKSSDATTTSTTRRSGDPAAPPGAPNGGPSGGTGSGSSGGSVDEDQGATGGSTSTEVAEETAGPYPGDGSNGPNALTQSGIVRRDIRRSFGDASGSVTGVPLTVEFRLIDLANGGAAKAGAAIYVWHCTPGGEYSLYTGSAQNENYLRGVQASDKDGKVSFATVFPGAYSGRYPHIHFEVYDSVASATKAGHKLRTSQLALPTAACEAVYATSGYEASARNYPQTPISQDMVFGDGWSTELATVTGNVTSGMVATLHVAV